MAKQNGDRAVMQNAVKTLATNIRFASVDNPVHSIVVTSSIPNEGKSTIAVALSEALASGGKSVLLVECDMRRRSIAGMLGLHAQNGLYSVLSAQVELEDAVVRTSMRGVSFLDAEPHIPNPVDILGSRRFHSFVESLKSSYDYVVFDTPPLSAFVDAAVIGSVVTACGPSQLREARGRCLLARAAQEGWRKRAWHRSQLLRERTLGLLLRVLQQERQ